MNLIRVLFFLLALIANATHAQYPNRPVKIIIPFAPGGASDFVGRILQPRLVELLGQSIVIENRPGASGSLGVEAAARSAPDGYTLFLGNIGSIAINPGVFPKLAANPMTDLIAVTQVVDVPGALVANPSFPPNTVKEFVAYAKANPGKVNYASPGSGSQLQPVSCHGVANRFEFFFQRLTNDCINFHALGSQLFQIVRIVFLAVLPATRFSHCGLLQYSVLPGLVERIKRFLIHHHGIAWQPGIHVIEKLNAFIQLAVNPAGSRCQKVVGSSSSQCGWQFSQLNCYGLCANCGSNERRGRVVGAHFGAFQVSQFGQRLF